MPYRAPHEVERAPLRRRKRRRLKSRASEDVKTNNSVRDVGVRAADGKREVEALDNGGEDGFDAGEGCFGRGEEVDAVVDDGRSDLGKGVDLSQARSVRKRGREGRGRGRGEAAP